MKLFERDRKVNFVDENNVFLGYDIEQCCCEDAGWFISDKVGAVTDVPVPDLTPFVFDTAFFQDLSKQDHYGIDSQVVFRIMSQQDGSEFFIHLLNSHNGYYSHGFKFGQLGFDETTVIQEGGL